MCLPINELFDPDAKECFVVNVDYLGEDTPEAVAYVYDDVCDDPVVLFRHLNDAFGDVYRGNRPTIPMMRREFGFARHEDVRFRLTPLVA